MRLIDADDLKRQISILFSHSDPELDMIVKLIDVMPIIEVKPVKHGKWIDVPYNNWTCSVCKVMSCDDYDMAGTPKSYHYCPNCGAKMQGDKDE